jgi:hypothetical protein
MRHDRDKFLITDRWESFFTVDCQYCRNRTSLLTLCCIGCDLQPPQTWSPVSKARQRSNSARAVNPHQSITNRSLKTAISVK